MIAASFESQVMPAFRKLAGDDAPPPEPRFVPLHNQLRAKARV